MITINEKTAITLVCLGLVLIAVSIPLYLRKVGMNCVYGFRIRKAFENDENWYRINRYGAAALMCWAVVIMAVGIGCLYIEPEYVLMVVKVGFLSVLLPIALTVYFARRL